MVPCCWESASTPTTSCGRTAARPPLPPPPPSPTVPFPSSSAFRDYLAGKNGIVVAQLSCPNRFHFLADFAFKDSTGSHKKSRPNLCSLRPSRFKQTPQQRQRQQPLFESGPHHHEMPSTSISVIKTRYASTNCMSSVLEAMVKMESIIGEAKSSL